MAPTAEQWATFWKLGDVNIDGYIDEKDMAIIEYAYGAVPGDTNWIGAADINEDGVIGTKDGIIVSGHFGLNIWDYFGLAKPMPEWILPVVEGIFIGAIFGVLGTTLWLGK